MKALPVCIITQLLRNYNKDVKSMKLVYSEPEIEVIKFSSCDIILTSDEVEPLDPANDESPNSD